MKKLLIASLAALMVASATVPAQAGDEGLAIIGGVIGGLIIGEALRDHRHHPRPHRQRYYDYGYYSYERTCWTEYRRDWDPYARRYVTRGVRYCD